MARKKVCVCCKSIYEESISTVSILCPMCQHVGCDGASECICWSKATSEHWDPRWAEAAGVSGLPSIVVAGRSKT